MTYFTSCRANYTQCSAVLLMNSNFQSENDRKYITLVLWVSTRLNLLHCRQSIKRLFLPLPKMKCKALQGSSRPWADIETTTSVHHPHPQKDPNLWTRICPLGFLQTLEAWNFWASLVSLCVVCNFPSSTFQPFWTKEIKKNLSRSNIVTLPLFLPSMNTKQNLDGHA